MALTNIYPINTSVKKSVNYITKDEKITSKIFENQKYILEHLCTKNDAEESFKLTKKLFGSKVKTEGYFLYQSFKPGEVDEKTCFEIGNKLAKEYLKDEYQYILVTHTDKNHLHNHIVFNSVSLKTGKAFENKFKESFRLRQISNKLCEEYNLSTLEYPSFTKKMKEIINKEKRKEDIIEEKIIILKNISNSFEEFKNNLIDEKIEFKIDDKKIYFKLEGMKNYYKKINGKEFLIKDLKKYIDAKYSERNNYNKKEYNEELKNIDIENIINKTLYYSNSYNEFKLNLQKVNIILDDKNVKDIKFIYIDNNQEINFKNKKFNKNIIEKIIEDNIKLFAKNDYFNKETKTKNIVDLIFKNVVISTSFNDFKNNMLNDGVEINEDRKYLRFFLTDNSKKFLRARINGEYFYKEKIEREINQINEDLEYRKNFINQYINIEDNELKIKFKKMKSDYKNLFNESQVIKNNINYKNIFKELKTDIGYMIDLNTKKFNENYGLKHWGTINNTNIAMKSYNKLYLKYKIKRKSKITEKITNIDTELRKLYNENKKIQNINKELYKEITKLNNSRGNLSFERKINLQNKINENQNNINKNNKNINLLKYDKIELTVIRENIYKFHNLDYNKEKEIERLKEQELSKSQEKEIEKIYDDYNKK